LFASMRLHWPQTDYLSDICVSIEHIASYVLLSLIRYTYLEDLHVGDTADLTADWTVVAWTVCRDARYRFRA
jgi:hypothetical protein